MFAAGTCPSLSYLVPAPSSCRHPGSSWLPPAAMDQSGEELSWGLAGRKELGWYWGMGAEWDPQMRLLPWPWPALSWEQDGAWWEVRAEVLGAPSPVADCPPLHRRVFGLLEATRKLVLVAESFHHQRCVLKVEAFLHTWAGGER